MAFPSKEEVMSGDFEVDQKNFRADMEEKIKHIIELAKKANKGDEKPANQVMAH